MEWPSLNDFINATASCAVRKYVGSIIIGGIVHYIYGQMTLIQNVLFFNQDQIRARSKLKTPLIQYGKRGVIFLNIQLLKFS